MPLFKKIHTHKQSLIDRYINWCDYIALLIFLKKEETTLQVIVISISLDKRDEFSVLSKA
jgi:hypothetical protein